MSDSKSMGLYRNVDRVLADLASAGFSPEDLLTVDDLTPFDQYHYEGTDAVDDAITELEVAADSHILDIGAGLGGPARYMAATTGCAVTALELQADLNKTAEHLTSRCGLADKVGHIAGDILRDAVPDGTFDGIMSMLCFLHIPSRTELFAACAKALRPGGRMFIDDYVALAPLTPDELRDLSEKVWCPYVPDITTYTSDVTQAGFVRVDVENKTADWTAFVNDRYASFSAATDMLSARYDQETVAGLDDFYATVAALFNNGHLGGLRLTATRARD